MTIEGISKISIPICIEMVYIHAELQLLEKFVEEVCIAPTEFEQNLKLLPMLVHRESRFVMLVKHSW